MAQDTTPAIVVYQGTGSDAPFSIPFDKGYYGEIKVLFVRRGLANYTYYPDTYVVSGRLYAWQNGNTRVFTHTPRPSVGAVIYTDEDVAPVTSITLKDLSDNENIYLRSAEDDVLVRRLYAWKYENTIVYTDTPTPKLSSIVTDYQWHQLALRIVSLTNIVVSAISGQTITVDEVIYTRAVQHDISNNLLLTWTGETLEVGDFICIIRDTERGQPYEMPINQKHVEFALDNLERQIQELKDATDSALKVDPSYDIEDSHKMNPIQWLETILRSMDKSVRAFRYADGWLDYSLDDPNIAEIRKTWRHLLSTANIKNIREASRVLDNKIIYWTEYQDRRGNWKPLCKPDEWDSKIDEALEIAEESRDISNEAKGIANDAVDVANNAVSIANEAKATAEGIEDIAQEALDKVTQEITDREDADGALQDQITINKGTMDTHIANISNPHSVTKAQVGLGNVDNTSDLDKPISTATQAALDGKMSASVKYGATIVVSLDNANYKMTTTLKDQDGNTLGSAQVVDLPLESVVVSGSYDSVTKEVVLTLQDGSTIRFSVADLVSGLQTEITALNMLNADFVDDSTSVHKFVTSAEKTTWNNKQNAISDLATIRSNAQAGKTASDTIATYGNIVTHNVSEFATAAQGAKADTALQTGDNVSELVNDAGYLVMGDLTNFVTKNTAQTISGLKTFSADIVLSGTTSIKNTTSGVSYTMLYRDTSGIHVGTSTQALLLAGSNARPKFNNNDIAMLSDVPTAVSQLTNDTGFITNAVNDLQNYTLTSNLATVATSGSYNDLSDKPVIPSMSNRVNGASLSNSASVFYGTSSTAAATVEKVVSIPSITTLDVGTVIVVQPTVTSTVANSTIKLNNFSAYPMRYNNAAITTSTDSIVWNAAYPSVWVFDGTYWYFVAHGIDTNTTYGSMSVSEGTTGTATSNRVVRADYLKQIIQGTTLTDIDVATTGAVTDADSITSGIGKLQATKADKSELATVATSGSYNDLSNKPTIPTVNNPTITITQGGVTKGSFALNQATGDTIALDAGGGSDSSYHPDLFDHKWADHILNDVQWLRADTYSWQSGAVYQAAYQHLADDIDGKTLQSETVGSTTIQFYLADDGHKICPASEESNVLAIYNATGVAWYYIIDTANTRFKLPRRHSQKIVRSVKNADGSWYRLYADGWVEQGGYLTAQTISAGYSASQSLTFPITMQNINYCVSFGSVSTPVYQSATLTDRTTTGGTVYQMNRAGSGSASVQFTWQVSGQSAIDMTSFQNGEKYLYFYVGNFTQTALENTAGLNAELFNGKADLDLANAVLTSTFAQLLLNAGIDAVVERQEPTAENGYTWYRLYKSGWVEQGGTTSANITFPIEFSDSNYQIVGSGISNSDRIPSFYNKTTTTAAVKRYGGGASISWHAMGIAA